VLARRTNRQTIGHLSIICWQLKGKVLDDEIKLATKVRKEKGLEMTLFGSQATFIKNVNVPLRRERRRKKEEVAKQMTSGGKREEKTK